MGKFLDTVSRLFKKDDEEKQNNSAGTNASAAAAYTEQATQQTQQPVYKDNSVVKVNQPKQNGLYQYKSNEGLKSKEEANQQYNYAKSLGYDKQQALELIKGGTRWKDVALGENNRPIVSYQGNKYQDKEEANEQYKLALRTGLTKEEALQAMQQGTHWKEQALQLWEDEDYAKDAQDKGILGKATDMLSGITSVTSMQNNYEDAFAERLRKIGYSADEIEAMRERGTLADAAKEIEQSYQKVEDDTFWGQFKANLKLGNLSQQATLLRGRAVLNADEDEMKRADELYRQVAEYAERNKVALDDENQVASWISKDLANYLPQLVYQSETSTLPSMALALIGMLVAGGSGATKGYKAGQVIGSGVYSYTTMTGAAYEDLTEKGAEPVVAAHMAKDEALISSAIEMRDEAFDQFLGVWSKLGFGKKAEAELAKTFGKQLAGALKKWAGNTGQEGIEEITQELVSLANERRLADGHTDGGWKELAAYFIKELVDRVPEMGAAIQDKLEDKFPELLSFWADKETTEEAAQLLEAGRGGAVIGGVMGLTGTGLSIAQNRLYSADVNRSLDNVVAYGDQQTLSQLSDEELARTIQQAEALNRQDAVDVLEAEQVRRADNSRAETATAQPETQNAVDTEEDEEARWARYDSAREEEGIESLSTEELKDYAQILQNDIVRLGNNPNSDPDLIAEHEEIRSQVVKELSIRQTEEEAAAEAAKEAEKAQPKQETTAAEKPAEQPVVNNQQQVYDADTQPMAESAKGAQANDSIAGDQGQDSNSGGTLYGDRAGDISGVGREDQEQSGNVQERSEGSVQNQDNVGTERTGNPQVERGNGDNRTLRQRLFKGDSESQRVRERRSALDRRYRLKEFLGNPSRKENMDAIKNMRKFSLSAIGKALGSNHARGERLVNAWLSDTKHAETFAAMWGDHLEGLSDDDKRAFYQARAAVEILTSMSEGQMDGQTLADLLGISEEKANEILKSAKDIATDSLVKERIINKDGYVVGSKPFASQARQEQMQKGKNNKTADVGKGRAISKEARSLNYTQKYESAKGDTLVNVDGIKNGAKIYKRSDNEYIVVNKNGYVKGVAGELSAAAAIARSNSAGYQMATFRIFGGSKNGRAVNFNAKTTEVNAMSLVADEREVFAKENMMLRQNSGASDFLGVKYQNQENNMIGTTDFFEIDMTIGKDDDVENMEEGIAWIHALIEGSESLNKGKPGIQLKNGNRYRFFTMTANGAKNGKAVMVNADYYDNLKQYALSGLSEEDKLSLNPAKYMTASSSIFTPSNADMVSKRTGKKITVKDCLILPDVYVMRPNTLGQYMRTDTLMEGKEAENLDRQELIDRFTKTAVRQMMEQNPGMTEEQAKARADKTIPAQVDELIKKNKVGAMMNIMADMTMCVTDGMGIANIPGGMSTQFRGAGGFKGNLLGMDFASWWNDLVPLSDNAQEGYGWLNKDGSAYTGVRHILHDGKDLGVELKDRWGVWRFVKDYDCILFDSTVKFGSQFDQFGKNEDGTYSGEKAAEAFYKKAGNYELRSIPRENVYGKGVKSSTLEGMTTRGLGQILKNQVGFSEELVKKVMAENISDTINNIAGDKHAMAQLFGVDLGSEKYPASTDNVAKFIYAWGEEGFDSITVKTWVADKLGQIVQDQMGGKTAFAENNAAYQWIFPDVIGLSQTMTSIHTITNQLSQQVDLQENTTGGGLTLDGYKPLKEGQISSNRLETKSGKNTTAIARSPNTKGSDTQIRQNVHNAINNKMAVEYGLDVDNVFTAVGDTLSLYLDNDYDGDTATIFQGPVAQLFDDVRKENVKKNKNQKHTVWTIGTDEKGNTTIVSEERVGDMGPVLFTHAKGSTVDNITMESAVITETVRRYLWAKGNRNIGTFDMMLDRLSVLTDEDIKHALDHKYAKLVFDDDYEAYADMTPSQFRALLEARFSVAYVLAIDYAKSGLEFTEFFNLVNECDKMLTGIAIANGLIPAEADHFVPEFYKDSTKANKRQRYNDEAASKNPAIVSGNNMLDIIRKSGAMPKKSRSKNQSFDSWYATFASKLGKVSPVHLNYAMAMTDPAARNYTNQFLDDLDEKYREITSRKYSRNEDENFAAKRRAVYEEIQKAGNLTNEQFTDMMLMMLDRNGGSSKMIINFNQASVIDSNNMDEFDRQRLAELSTHDIISRNLDLVHDYNVTNKTVANMDKQIKNLGSAMRAARGRIDSLLQKSSGILSSLEVNAIDRATATMDDISQQIYKLENRLESLKSQNKKRFDREDFDAYNTEMRQINQELGRLKHQMDNIPAIASDELTKEMQKSIDDINKEVRMAWRQVSTYAEALDNLYTAYEEQLTQQEFNEARAAESYGRSESYFIEGTEGELRGKLFGNEDVAEEQEQEPENQQQQQREQEEQAPPPEEEGTPAPEEEPEMPPPPDEPPPESPTPPEAPEPPEPPKPPKQETKPKAEPKVAAPEQKEEAPKPFGKRRESIVKSASTIKVSANKYAGVIAGTEDAPIRSKISRKLTSFANAVKDMTAGKKTGADVYAAYSTLDGTQYNSEDVTAYFDEMNDRYEAMRRNTTDETTEAYEKAVDKALAAFAARYKNVERINSQTAKLTEDAVKSTTDKFFDKAKKFYESWQVKAPTFFKMLCGFKKGSEGYQLARMVNNGYGKKCDLVTGAYKNLERVRNLRGFDKLVNGDIKVHLESVNADISALEAINLSRMLDTVMASDNTLSNVRGFNLADGTHISTMTYDEEGRANNIVGTLRNELTRYFNDKASSIEKEYYKAISDVFREFTPEVERVGKQYNGMIDMYSPDWYSPIMWGKGGKGNFENFNAKEAMLKTMPRYMKARSEKAGGSLYIESMDKVIGNYINSMADYLAYADLRNTLAIMNQNAELRTTKTLAEIAGENMGQSFARFANEYVKDMTTTQFDKGGFFEKLRLQMQKGILIGSPSVMIKQSASYWNAASVIDMKYLVSALSEGDLNRYFKGNAAAALEYRKITGNFDPTLTEVFNNSASKNPLVNMFKNGIGKVDYATVKRVYVAACLQVEAQGISHNSAEFEAAVKELFTEAVAETQPVFDTALRAENQRTSNEWVRMASMFRTQQTQNFNALLTACGEYKADPTATNKQAKSKAIKGLVASSVTFAVLSSAADLMLHRLKKYRDRDDEDKDKDKLEITGKNVGKRLAMSSIETAASTLWMGDYMSQYLIDMISNGKTKEFYGVSLGPLSLISDTVTALKDFRTKPSIDGFRKLSMYLTQMGGVPVNNLYNLGNSALMYYLDITGDNPDKFDDLAKYMDDYLKLDNKMIRAITSDNESRTNELWKELKKQKGDKADDQMRSLVKDQYSKGKLKNEQAENLLIKYGELTKENEAAKRVAKWEFDKAHPEYKDDVTEANVWKWKQTIEPTGVSLKTYVDALKYFKEISKDKENGNDRNDMLVYLSKLGLTEDQMLAMYSSFGQNFYQSFDPTKGAYAKYNQYGKPAGISTEDFVKYYEHFNSLTSDKDKNGKTINNSKKKKVIAYINSLSISKEQKRALWKAFGYMSKAPW